MGDLQIFLLPVILAILQWQCVCASSEIITSPETHSSSAQRDDDVLLEGLHATQKAEASLLQQNSPVNSCAKLGVGYLRSSVASFMKKGRQVKQVNEGGVESTLGRLLTTIITRELKECSLVVASDEGFHDSTALQDVLRTPNLRQVVKIRTWEDLYGILWESNQCRGYLFMLQDYRSLLTFANTTAADEDIWNYSGRYVLVGASQDELDHLTHSKKGSKTEHIIGLVQSPERERVIPMVPVCDKPGGDWEWLVLMNQVYWSTQVSWVTTWRRNKSLTNQHQLFFPDKLADLRGSTLKVVTFNLPPHMIIEGELMYGREYHLVTTLAPLLNFSIAFLQPPRGETWGEMLPNGTWTGLTGMLVRDEVDLGVANYFLTNIENVLGFTDLTNPYDADVSCFLVRMEPPVPRWQSLALPFTMHTWLAILVGLVTTCPALYLVVGSSRGDWNLSAVSSCLYNWGLHLRVSQKAPVGGDAPRVLVITLWLYAVILTTGYSSNLTAFLTVTRAPPSMNTFRELQASSRHVTGLGPFFQYFMASSSNFYIKDVSKRYVSLTSLKGVWAPLRRGEAVFIEGRKYLEHLIRAQFTPFGHAPTMRIMKECFAPLHVSVLLQNHSPLKAKLDLLLGWVFQSGLPRHWFLQTLRQLKKKKREEKASEEEEEVEEEERGVPLRMEHMEGAFLLLLLGLLTAILVLLVELGHRNQG